MRQKNACGTQIIDFVEENENSSQAAAFADRRNERLHPTAEYIGCV